MGTRIYEQLFKPVVGYLLRIIDHPIDLLTIAPADCNFTNSWLSFQDSFADIVSANDKDSLLEC